jgi:hypothetical protein
LLTTLLILLIGLALARLTAGKLVHWAVPAIVVELFVGFVLGTTVLGLVLLERRLLALPPGAEAT